MGRTTGWLKCGYVYSNGTTSSPDCTLHAAVTHVITVLEQQSLMQILMVYSQVSLANTHNLVLTAVHSPYALKDSMHAIMESYEATPHIDQYFPGTSKHKFTSIAFLPSVQKYLVPPYIAVQGNDARN